PAEGKQRLRELTLPEPIEKITLVLRAIFGLEQLVESVQFTYLRVVAGRDVVAAERERMIEEGSELDLGVAQHIGIGRAPGLVVAQERAEHAFLVFGGEVDDVDVDADALGHCYRIDEVLP